MKRDNLSKISEYLKAGFDKYKYVCIVCAAGLLLALWPFGGEKAETPPAEDAGAQSESFSSAAEQLAKELELAFADIEGVGRVKVLLTVKSGYESVFAYDQNLSQSASDTRLVTITGGGEQSPVVRKINYPVFLGAVVICDGGENPKIKLELTEAVKALTGITSDNITISKMKN